MTTLLRHVFFASLAGAVLPSLSPADAEAQWARGRAFDAIAAGRDVDGTQLIVCRSTDPAYPGQHPGKTRADWSACAIGFGGREQFTTSFETLRPVWSPPSARVVTAFGRDSNGATKLGFCRAQVEGSLQVGKKLDGENACTIPYGGREVKVTSYEQLNTTSSFDIREARGIPFPTNALIAGAEANGKPIYACIGNYQGGTHPGKTRLDWQTCHIGWGGVERETTDFRVLIANFLESTQDLKRRPPFRAGSDSNGAALGVCLREIQNTTQVGKYRMETQGCHVSFGGQEMVFTSGFWTLRRVPFGFENDFELDPL